VENNTIYGGFNMKGLISLPRYITGVLLIAALIFTGTNASALTVGETYTISVEKVNSNGSLSSIGVSTTATADSNGKISFTLTGIPDNSTCNFLVTTIKDSGDTTVRRSIAPCPNPGEALPMGVSGLTNKQTDALIAALSAAGTDDPVLAVFGYAIVRSSAITSSELTFMADLCNQGINNAGGFIDYLTSNGVTGAQITSYRSNIITRLANTSSGYSKLIKDSVDAGSSSAALDARGEAASKLLLVLVQAATDAGFSQDRVLEAFNGMGSVVKPLMTQGVIDGDITATTSKMIDSSIGGGIQKLRADKDMEKYSAALTTLGASGSDVTSYQTAATTLLNAMTAVFQTFEQVFDGTETDTDIQNSQTAMDTAMQTAFGQFMTDTAASNGRLTTMIANIDTALGAATGLQINEFQFLQSDGTPVNWPLTMVILTDWISSVVTNGGSVSYTRDTTNIPAFDKWHGSCSVGGHDNEDACVGNAGTWTSERTTFGPGGLNYPASYATIFGIQEDIMILEFVRWAAQSSAGQDMSAHEALEKSFSDSVVALAGNIGGTTDGSTAISSIEKSAIVTLMKSPQF